MKLDPIKSATEAMTLSQQKNDLFYHRAYLIQKWLAMISINTLAQYAARPRTYPQMQAGQAFHALTDVFGYVPDCKVPYLAAALLRFSSTDHPFAPLLPPNDGPGKPHQDDRRYVSAFFYAAACNCSLESLPPAYGNARSLRTRRRGRASSAAPTAGFHPS
jgi:hypothetical protein